MERTKWKTFCVDGDSLDVLFRYDERDGVYHGDYPLFEESPRRTPAGRPWRSVVTTGCPHAAGEYDDCGSCPHLVRQGARDLIGVCFHSELQQCT